VSVGRGCGLARGAEALATWRDKCRVSVNRRSVHLEVIPMMRIASAAIGVAVACVCRKAGG